MASKNKDKKDKDDQPQPVKSGTHSRKLLAVGILVVGVGIAYAVTKLEGDRRATDNAAPSTTVNELDSQVDLGDSSTDLGDLAQLEPEVETKPETDPKPEPKAQSPPATTSPFDERAKLGVEPLPPAPPKGKSGAQEGSRGASRAPPKKTAPSEPSAKQSPQKSNQPPAKSTKNAGTAKDGKDSLGKLTEIGNKKYRSTAGLIYAPGSQEGHRLKHILRHSQDDSQRPVHGVFDGDQDAILAVIDEAYLIAKKGGKNVTVERDGGRMVYLADVGRRIGYIGGQSGKRQKFPAARHVRLVLEGSNVVTAYPDRP